MKITFNNKLYSKIFDNISKGISFKNTDVGLVNEFIKKHKNFKVSDDKCSKDMIHCISNLSYNLYTRRIGFSYNPMIKIDNGWCLQNTNDNKIWTITNRINIKFDYSEVIAYEENQIHKIDYIPCIKLDKILKYNKINYVNVETDFIDEYEYEYRKLFSKDKLNSPGKCDKTSK